MAINQKIYGNVVLKGDLYITGVLRVTNQAYLLKLTTGGGAIAQTPDGAVAGTTKKKIKILIDNVVYYLLAASDWVDEGSQSISPSASRSPSSSASASVSPSASSSLSRSPSASASSSVSPSGSSSSSASLSLSPSASVSPSSSASSSAST